MINAATWDFIHSHVQEDVRQLALRSLPEGVDRPVALQQIAGHQLALRKFPSFASRAELWYPPHLNLEQCSSEATALYKRHLAERLGGDSLYDLTGGFGIDFMMLAPRFSRAVYVEPNRDLCQLAQHNFPLLGCSHAEIVCDNAEGVLRQMQIESAETTLIFIDPARRDSVGRKVSLIEDCTPDVCALQDEMRVRARYTLIKLSPMLDLTAALRALHGIEEVHVVSVAGECKELLLVMGQDTHPADKIPIFCVDLMPSSDEEREPGSQTLIFTFAEESATVTDTYFSFPEREDSLDSYYLYEPNASIMKAGAFKTIAKRFSVQKLAPHAHLYASHSLLPQFPGRCWKVLDYATFGKKELRRLLADIDAADLTVRGFPASVATLRKQLRLREGGAAHLIATTQSDGTKLLLRVQMVSVNSKKS